MNAALVFGILGVARVASAQGTAEPAVAPVAPQPSVATAPADAPLPPPVNTPQPVVNSPQVVAPAPAIVLAPAPVAPAPVGPVRMRYRSGSPIPPGYELEESVSRPMVIGGVLTLGLPYLIGVTGLIVADGGNELAWLALPVAGPWIARSHYTDKETRVVLGLDGLAQGIGALLIIAGVTWTRQELVRSDLAQVWVAPAPVAGGGYGMAVSGAF